MNKRTKATSISMTVRAKVFNRDGQHCFKCGSYRNLETAHYISRANAGKGIEQNLAMMCHSCHYEYDFTPNRKAIAEEFRKYLDDLYPDFVHEDRFYKKGG